MSAVQRRRGQSLHLELPDARIEVRPAIAALFLIRFDVKAGYTIAWKQSIPGLDLAESVEFKSLPSGLHDVEEDLVYFMHDDYYAGISAFINRSAAQWERNSLMIAVGALVPLDHGRLGKSWRHAGNLKELAEELVIDPTKTQPLQEFWDQNRMPDETVALGSSSRSSLSHHNGNGMESESPTQVQRKQRMRGISNVSASGFPGFGLSGHHPALSLPSLLNTFGPLVYPLYKAALLRKRILIMNQAPVELACNFVYDISIISNIPSSVAALVPLEPLPIRIQPLFSVGVYDIDALVQKGRLDASSKNELGEQDLNYGWVACTTDDVLGLKSGLYDVLVTIPPAYTKQAKEKCWPTLKSAEGNEMRASQRDLRRYRTLRQGMKRTSSRSRAISPYVFATRTAASTDEDSTTDLADDNDQTTLLTLENTHETFDDASSTTEEKLIEPLSWGALAYSSFMWWASAGEKRADLDEEFNFDSAMFRDFSEYSDNLSTGATTPGDGSRPPRSRRRSSTAYGSGGATPGAQPQGLMSDGLLSASAVPEMAIIAYFHRFTTLILRTLAELVDTFPEVGEAEGRGGDGEEGVDGTGESDVYVSSEDMVRMGLDCWSEGDRRFVEELVELYWGRRADVQGGRVECCGMRIY